MEAVPSTSNLQYLYKSNIKNWQLNDTFEASGGSIGTDRRRANFKNNMKNFAKLLITNI